MQSKIISWKLNEKTLINIISIFGFSYSNLLFERKKNWLTVFKTTGGYILFNLVLFQGKTFLVNFIQRIFKSSCFVF